MNQNRFVIAVLMMCIAVLASRELGAQGRGLSAKELRDRVAMDPAAARAAKLAELDAWLRRLVGRYRITGSAGVPYRYNSTCRPGLTCDEPPLRPPASFRGLADCVSIGGGPGVSCIVNLVGPDGAPIRNTPKISLYGLDPDNLGIRYLQVNAGSIAEGEFGELEGNSITFRVRCPIVRAPMYNTLYCRREVKIYAPPDGKSIQIWTRTDQPTGPVMGLPVIQGPQVEDLLLQRLP